MSALSEPTFAWEPLTPRGVAAFARASFGRLFLVQTIVAVGAVLAVRFGSASHERFVSASADGTVGGDGGRRLERAGEGGGG